MPAYYKLLEALDKRNDIDVDAVCLGKLAHEGIDKKGVFKFPNLKINFYVIPYQPIQILKIFGTKLHRWINGIINDLFQFFYCLNLVFKDKYDLVYIDRANIVFGAICAFFFRKKVVVRFFGIGSLIKRMRGMTKYFKAPFSFLSCKAPFSYIICSKDGSSARYFFERFINKKVPYEILLNGVDSIEDEVKNNNFIREKYHIPDSNKIILFLSKLSIDKGADLFIRTLNSLYKINRNFFALVIGDGPLRKELESEVKKNGLSNNIKVEGQVAHDIIYDYYNAADIYVSLNLLGNLCNTVLEAINIGKCIVTFKKDKIDYTDEDTENILLNTAVLIDKRHVIEELPIVLDDLINNEQKIKRLSQKTKMLSKNLLSSWDKRISYEVDLLQKIAGRK